MYRLRPVTADDELFLWSMLYEAVEWREPGGPRDVGEALARRLPPETHRYVDGFGERESDGGVVAVWDDERIGAAWYRLFDTEEPGYGYVADDVPELSVAVAQPHRHGGIGTTLIRGALAAARDAGFRAVSLSVDPDNPARLLYTRLGFERVASREGGWTMVKRLGD